MLRSLKEFFGYEVRSIDRQAGKVDDFWFDPETWQIRFLAAKAGTWLDSETVLIPQPVFERPNWSTGVFPIAMNEEQLASLRHIAPQAADLQPSKGEPQVQPAWSYPLPGEFPSPVVISPPTVETTGKGRNEAQRWESEHPNLRSARRFLDCGLTASDEKGGLVDDLIVSDDEWSIRFLVGTTGRLLTGSKVLISPIWVKEIDEEAREVHLGQSLATINDGPEYDPEAPVNRQVEEVIYDYLGRPKFRI